MPEFKVRTPDGRYFNVTVPPGTSKEDALAYAQSHMPPPQGPMEQAPVVHAPGTEPGGIYDRIAQKVSALSGGLLASPKGFRGPGVIANASAALQRATKGPLAAETPQQNYDRTVPGLETITDITGGFAGPSKTFLQRLGTGIAVPAGIAALGGKDIMQRGIEGGVGQGIAEILGGILRTGRLGSLANTARSEFEQQMAAQTAKVAHDKAMLKTLEDIDKQKYDKLVGKLEEQHAALKSNMEEHFKQKTSSHEDLLAGTILEDAKKDVPAWSNIPSTVAGLYTAVLGKGKELLSEAFDKALQAAKGTATGKTIDIPVSDARTLGVAVKQTDRVLPQDKGDLRMLVSVDAPEVIDALPGLKDKALKARTQQALSEADLGVDPKAMREYTVGKGTIDLVDENKIFKFDDTTNQFHVDRTALAKGLLSRDRMDTVQNRGMGDFDTLPSLQVAKAGPLAPEIPPLKLPEPPAPRGPLGNPTPIPDPDKTGAITSWQTPGTPYQRSRVGASLGALLGGLMGSGHGGTGIGLGSGAGAAAGYGLGAMIPKEFVTKAPMSPLEQLLGELATVGTGTALRNIGNSEASAGERTQLTDDERTALLAEIANQRSDNSALQTSLEVNPVENR